ncbi:DUF2304 domain-containing protein [Gulosibacter macacae]|uniref:DUF2304 domain-containing protein n=1 Tax=Gulosibacter macacae TaxID=2488791 RepID=A0A3P3VVD7_9MICO|nr:DUF2304 domain-containing protein [Gulosibacter macacae]RRJ86765.1 DUF2304 domain-containing protein [Gulosibacter macacae]
MDTSQIIIKVVLIAAFAIAAIAIIFPGRGARGLAIRRIFWVLGLLGGIVAIAFPQLTSAVANWLGVGRGTDLLLYLLIVFFVAYVVTTSAHDRKTDRTITVLARKVALMEAELRKTGSLRFEATHTKGNESMFDATGPIELPMQVEDRQ